MLMFWWILVDSALGKCDGARAQVHPHVLGFGPFQHAWKAKMRSYSAGTVETHNW